jgi:hypothetical protein
MAIDAAAANRRLRDFDIDFGEVGISLIVLFVGRIPGMLGGLHPMGQEIEAVTLRRHFRLMKLL